MGRLVLGACRLRCKSGVVSSQALSGRFRGGGGGRRVGRWTREGREALTR